MSLTTLTKKQLIKIIQEAPEGVKFDFMTTAAHGHFAATIQFRTILDPRDKHHMEFKQKLEYSSLFLWLKDMKEKGL